MKYYLDEDLSYKIAEILRSNHIDAVSAHEVGREGAGVSDEEQLAYAATSGRCLVTYNGRHYVTLTNKFFEKEWKHSGVLIIPSSLPSNDFGLISRALDYYARHHPEGVTPYCCAFLKAGNHS